MGWEDRIGNSKPNWKTTSIVSLRELQERIMWLEERISAIEFSQVIMEQQIKELKNKIKIKMFS